MRLYPPLIAIALSLSGCQYFPPKQSNQITVVNKNFTLYWREATSVPRQNIKAHTTLFKNHFLSNKNSRRLYMDAVFKQPLTEAELNNKLSKKLETSLVVFRKNNLKIKKLFKNFKLKALHQLARLKKLLPKFTSQSIPVYGMLSIGSFTGGKRAHEGRTVLVFGIDQIAEEERNFPIVFSHEVFHAYHDQVNPAFRKQLQIDNEILISAAFIEGLAVFASGALNPRHKDIILNGSELRSWCKDKKYLLHIKTFLKDAAALNYKNFKAKSDLYAKWFYTSRSQQTELPDMAGYCIGSEIVKELSYTHSLETMSGWSLPELKKQSKLIINAWLKAKQI